MRTSTQLGAFCLSPYANQDIHYYYIIGDLPKLDGEYNISEGQYDPETGILSYTFEDVTVDNEDDILTYPLPVFVAQNYSLGEGEGYGAIFINSIELTGNVNGKKKKLTADTSTIRKPTLEDWPLAQKIESDDADSTQPLYYIRTSQFCSETVPSCAFIIALVRIETGNSKLLSMVPNTSDNSKISCEPLSPGSQDHGITESEYIVATNMMACSPNQYSKIEYGGMGDINLMPLVL